MADDVEQIKVLMTKGFEEAFMKSIVNLFGVYSANVGVTEGQAERTKKGIENSVEAYRLAMEAVNSWDG
jgi:hypothetical protein